MTVASPSLFVVADIRWLLREFQRFPSRPRKNFKKKFPAASTSAPLWRCHETKSKLEGTGENRKLNRQQQLAFVALSQRQNRVIRLNQAYTK
jgi:hypothetical protein